MGVCSFKQNTELQTERLRGCLQPEEGETEDILLLSRNNRDRQTDREERSAQTLAGEPSSFFSIFSFKKKIFTFFFFWLTFASLTPDPTGLLKTREPSPSGVAYQGKRGTDSLRSLNFVQKVACCKLFLNSGLGNRNQEKHMSFAEWWYLSHIISNLPKSPAREVYASPLYRCGN